MFSILESNLLALIDLTKNKNEEKKPPKIPSYIQFENRQNTLKYN